MQKVTVLGDTFSYDVRIDKTCIYNTSDENNVTCWHMAYPTVVTPTQSLNPNTYEVLILPRQYYGIHAHHSTAFLSLPWPEQLERCAVMIFVSITAGLMIYNRCCRMSRPSDHGEGSPLLYRTHDEPADDDDTPLPARSEPDRDSSAIAAQNAIAHQAGVAQLQSLVVMAMSTP